MTIECSHYLRYIRQEQWQIIWNIGHFLKALWAWCDITLCGGSDWPSDHRPNALLKTCPLNTPASDHSNILCKNLCGTFTEDILIASNYKFDYEVRFNSESGWCSITVLIKRTDDSPQSCTRMFDLSSSRRNGKWSDPPRPPLSLSAALTFPLCVTAAAEGHPIRLTVHFLPAVTSPMAAKVWEVCLQCRHLMKQRNRWSEEWWRNERRRRTSCENDCQFCLEGPVSFKLEWRGRRGGNR